MGIEKLGKCKEVGSIFVTELNKSKKPEKLMPKVNELGKKTFDIMDTMAQSAKAEVKRASLIDKDMVVNAKTGGAQRLSQESQESLQKMLDSLK